MGEKGNAAAPVAVVATSGQGLVAGVVDSGTTLAAGLGDHAAQTAAGLGAERALEALLDRNRRADAENDEPDESDEASPPDETPTAP